MQSALVINLKLQKASFRRLAVGRESEDEKALSSYEALPTGRALDKHWWEIDKFKYKIKIKDHPVTIRGILSTVSSIYNSLVLAAAAILPANIFLQNICRLKLEWDQKIPEEHVKPSDGKIGCLK